MPVHVVTSREEFEELEARSGKGAGTFVLYRDRAGSFDSDSWRATAN